ncbi:unnamed protein product [Rotaria sordida]|uniref:B30.2/SPRY domain-containing protein n=1 Tax=Rotaria sordida TaxID=392033 RepID=A0A818RRG6_9BILA|nr:unnamed protein product [Rotaria sordida]
MANEQCSNELSCDKTSEKPYLLDSSTFSSEKMNNFGEFRFDSNRSMNSSIRFSNNDCTVEWLEPSMAVWIPVETKAKLHSGKWSLEFDVEWMGTHQIGVGFLLDWNIGSDWGFFGYLGSSSSAWSYDPSTGDIVTDTESIHGNLPKFTGNSGVIGLELDLPKNEIGKFTFIVDGVRIPTKQLSNSGAVAIPAVCLLSRGQKVTIRNLGITWSDPTPLNVFPPPPFSKSIKPAVGHGIEIIGSLCGRENCSDAGTLLMPFVCTNGSSHTGDNGSCPSCYACVLKSEMPEKNQNRQWNFTGIAQQYTRESQLVQTINMDAGASYIYLNGRNFSPVPGHRYFARSTNGADQFTEFGIDSSLIEPVTKAWTGVVCSIERISINPSRILFSGPANATVRSNLTLRLSYDEAHSWSISRILFSGLSGYSDIAVVGDGKNVALVFENGEETFADQISVAVVPVSWIENNKKNGNKKL